MLSLLYGPTLTSVHDYQEVLKVHPKKVTSWMEIHRERQRERLCLLPTWESPKSMPGATICTLTPGCHCTKGFAHGSPGNALKMQPSRHYSFALQTRRTEVRQSKWLTQDTEQVSSLGFQVQSFFFFNVDFFFEVLNLLQYCFCFMFWFLGHEACRILAPPPGMEPTPPTLEGKVLTTGPPVKSPGSVSAQNLCP